MIIIENKKNCQAIKSIIFKNIMDNVYYLNI